MATRKRPGSAKRTVARQEAARKRSAPGKRFVGETAEQSENARRSERRKVARMAHAARAAKPAQAARTAGHAKKARGGANAARRSAEQRTPRKAAEAKAALRAAEEDAALHGAEVEPASSERAVADDPAAETRERGTLHLLPGASERTDAGRAGAGPGWEPSVDASSTGDETAIGEASPPPLRWALADLARGAFGLARTLVGVPFRIALAIPRIAIRAVASV